MTDINEVTEFVESQIERMDAQAWLIVAAVVAVMVAGFVLRLSRARATKRLQTALDIYADRQMARHVRLDAASQRQSAITLDSFRKSGLVMGVRR